MWLGSIAEVLVSPPKKYVPVSSFSGCYKFQEMKDFSRLNFSKTMYLYKTKVHISVHYLRKLLILP